MNNQFIIVGRIYKDFELKETSTNKRMVELPIVAENGKDDATFLKVLVFNSVAESLAQYCKKGDLIGVSGIIKNNNWDDQQGNKHYDISFIANKVSYLSTSRKEEKKEEQPKEDPYEEYGKEVSIDDNFLD